MKERRDGKKIAKSRSKSPSLEDWLANRAKPESASAVPTQPDGTSSDREPSLPVFSLSTHFAGVQNLPPSLIPPPPDAFSNLEIEEWG